MVYKMKNDLDDLELENAYDSQAAPVNQNSSSSEGGVTEALETAGLVIGEVALGDRGLADDVLEVAGDVLEVVGDTVGEAVNGLVSAITGIFD